MKNFLNSIWSVLMSISEARYATELARNGKWKEAQLLYKK
jgi:hypothetical protein